MARKTPTPAFKEPPIPGLDAPDNSPHPAAQDKGVGPVKNGLAGMPAPVPSRESSNATAGAANSPANATGAAHGAVNATLNATVNSTANATANATVNSSDDYLNQLVPTVNSTTAVEDYPTADLGYAGLKMAGALFFVLALLFLGLWFMRRIQARGIFARPGADKLQYVSQIVLGQRKNVVVVRFLNKFLVLGVTDTQINLLTEMEAADEHDSVPTGQPDNSEGVDFDQILGKTIADDSSSKPSGPGSGGAAG